MVSPDMKIKVFVKKQVSRLLSYVFRVYITAKHIGNS